MQVNKIHLKNNDKNAVGVNVTTGASKVQSCAGSALQYRFAYVKYVHSYESRSLRS